MRRFHIFSPSRLKLVAGLLLAVVTLCCFAYGLTRLEQSHSDAALRQLEDSLHRAAVACYASQGVYPPDLNDLVERYGIQIDEDRYTVFYNVFAENLMPDITVVEKQP